MTMQELEGKRVKISAGTITVKDTNGKTQGMIRGVRPFKSWSNQDSFNHFKALKQSGIWGNTIDRNMINCVILDGNKLYYLNNTRPLDTYRQYFEGRSDWEAEKKAYDFRMNVMENAVAAGMTVINCEVLTA